MGRNRIMMGMASVRANKAGARQKCGTVSVLVSAVVFGGCATSSQSVLRAASTAAEPKAKVSYSKIEPSVTKDSKRSTLCVRGTVVDSKGTEPISYGWVAIAKPGGDLKSKVEAYLFGRMSRRDFERSLVMLVKPNPEGRFEITGIKPEGNLVGAAYATSYSPKYFALEPHAIASGALQVQLEKKPPIDF